MQLPVVIPMSADIKRVRRNQMLTGGTNESCVQFARNVDTQATPFHLSGTDISSVCGCVLWRGVTRNRPMLGGSGVVEA